MPITHIQPIATGTFEATSGSATLAATEADSQIVIIAGIVGDATTATSISTPAGFSPFGFSSFGSGTDYARVAAFIKPAASAGETSWTLTLTGGQSRRVVWAALEVSGLDTDWPDMAYGVGPVTPSGTSTTVTSATVTAGAISETFDGLSVAIFMATDTGGTTPTISAHTDGFDEVASQSGTDASSRAATLSVATKTELTINTPTCTATISPSSYVGSYLLVLTAVDAHHAATVTAMSGYEVGTATSITSTGTGTALGTMAPFDGVTGTPAIVATSPRSGGFCLELSSAAAAENLTWITGAGMNLQSGTVQHWSQRFHIYFPTSLPSGDVDLFSVEAGSLANGVIVRYVAASQKLGVQIGTGTQVLSDATVAANTWIGVDVLYDPRTTTHTCRWQVDYNAATTDTTPPVVQTTASTAGMTAGAVTTVRRGWTAATTATVRYDDEVGSKHRKAYPIGDTRIVPLKPDPAGTPTVSGTAANFRTFTANGTLATWTAAATITTLDDLPPTIGAASDGLTQITVATSDYVEVPMETFTLAPGFVAVGGRWYWAGWAASGNPATFRFQPADGTSPTFGAWGETVDAGFDNAALVWMGDIHNKDAQLNTFYPMPQTIVDALAAQFGFSTDANPDAGTHCVLFELAVQPTQTVNVFGDPAGMPRVEAKVDQLTGGVQALQVYTPVGQAATVRWYDAAGTPTSVAVPANSNPYTMADDAALNVSAADIPSAPRIEMDLP